MAVNQDFVVERTIQELRKVVSSGQEHLFYLNNAINVYRRQSQLDEEQVDKIFGESFAEQLGVELPAEFLRSDAIRFGLYQDNKEKQTVDKVDTWFLELHDAALEHFSTEHFQEYRGLSEPPSPVMVKEENGGERYIQELESAIVERLRLLAKSLTDLGEHENIAPAVRDDQGGWPHLRGLIDDSKIDDYLKRMRTRRTRSEMSNAIGAAKEIVEATLRGLIDVHNLQIPSGTPDLHDWWKILRPKFIDPAIQEALGGRQGALLKLMGNQVSTVQSLSELRNRVGSGHGTPKHPVGLKSAHALLAVDTAHTLTRFAVQASA
ncbi:MAG: abortive infection family protein [Yaniella sp.]|uniref:abortive infection family protein n=1 Tax=Yaniella sp. TaxID=2773929 RepID=UPI003F9BB619